MFREGEKVKGKVTRCVAFGAFVEIAPGVEGLVHISEMSYRKRVMRSEDEVSPGQEVPVVIKEIDLFKRRISLSMRDAEGDPWLEVPNKYRTGQTVKGVLEKKERFGYFVRIEPGITGLVPISRIKGASNASALEKLKPGEPFNVTIDQVNQAERKISLSPSETEGGGEWQAYRDDSGKSMGSLGEKLQQAMKKKEK
jgi:small subunit ribosomal protein S1